MSTLSHHSPGIAQPARPWTSLVTSELWASVAISVMWIAVVAATIWGPNFVSTSPGGDNTTIPSGIAVGFFAFLGSWVVARCAFGRKRAE